MWKCVHRGLRGSASLLKADQPNGGCIVGSSVVIKDNDELSPQSNAKNKCSSCGDGSFRTIVFRGKHKIHHEHPSLVQGSNKDGKKDSRSQPPKIVTLPSLTPTGPHNSSVKDNDGYSIIFHNSDKASSATLLSCRKCHKIYEGNLKCACFSKPNQLSWVSKKLGTKSQDVSTSLSTLFKHSSLKPLSSEHSTSNFGLLEENKHLNHSSIISQNFDSPKLCDASSSSRFSCLPPNHFVEEKERSNLQENHAFSSSKSPSSQNPSYCLLNLPFLSCNLVRYKGLNRLSACWLNNSKNEFGRDDDRDKGSDRKGESEEAKEGTWRNYHIHQSLLGAIGWSSALLLGWFLMQCRIWRLRGEGHIAERKGEDERKRCIAGMVARLLFSGKSDPHQFLKVLPCKLRESVSRHERKEKSSPSENEDKIKVEPCNGGSEGYYSDTLIIANGIKEAALSNNFSAFPQSSEGYNKASRYPRNQVKEQVISVKKNRVIPMPWHDNQQKELPFGPITLEEAAKEAGKGLEEAQAEILLLLALEKLDEGENASYLEPSAIELLNSAACLGSTAAAFNLGICYEMGVGGVSKDLTLAYYWYTKASNNGHAAATYNIAVFHAQGLAGLCPNTQLAHQLLKRASLLGQPEATDALALLTSLKPTESHDVLKSDLAEESCSSVSQQSGGVEQTHNLASLMHWGSDGIQEGGSFSDISFASNGSDASKSTVNSSPNTKSSVLGWSKFTHLKLGYIMELFCIPFSKPIELEDSFVEILLDNTVSVKKSDSDYVLPYVQ